MLQIKLRADNTYPILQFGQERWVYCVSIGAPLPGSGGVELVVAVKSIKRGVQYCIVEVTRQVPRSSQNNPSLSVSSISRHPIVRHCSTCMTDTCPDCGQRPRVPTGTGDIGIRGVPLRLVCISGVLRSCCLAVAEGSSACRYRECTGLCTSL